MITPTMGKMKTSSTQRSLLPTVRLDWRTSTRQTRVSMLVRIEQEGSKRENHTPYENVEHEDNQADNAASNVVAQQIVLLDAHGSRVDEGDEGEEEGKDVLEHVG